MGLNIVHNIPVPQLFANFINEKNHLKKIQRALKIIVYNVNDDRISSNTRMISIPCLPLINAAILGIHSKASIALQ